MSEQAPWWKHGIDPAQLPQREAVIEFVAIEIVAQPGAEEVAEFRALGEVIDRDHIVDADRVESMHQIAADHAGGAGNHDSHPNSSS